MFLSSKCLRPLGKEKKKIFYLFSILEKVKSLPSPAAEEGEGRFFQKKKIVFVRGKAMSVK
jgi:hypothetical protein